MSNLLDEILKGNVRKGAVVEVDLPNRLLTGDEWLMLQKFLFEMHITLIIKG